MPARSDMSLVVGRSVAAEVGGDHLPIYIEDHMVEFNYVATDSHSASVSGAIEARDSSRLALELRKLAAGATLDLSECEYIDDSAISVLIALRTDNAIRLYAPSERVMRTLASLGLVEIFEIQPSPG